MLRLWIEGWLDAAFGVEYLLLDQRCVDRLSGSTPDGLLVAVHHAGQFGQGAQRHLPKGHAAVFLVLSLQRPGKILVALICHHVKLVYRLIEDAHAALIHRKAQAATEFLTFFDCARGLVEGANLEDVGVVPSLAQRRVAKMKRNGSS